MCNRLIIIEEDAGFIMRLTVKSIIGNIRCIRLGSCQHQTLDHGIEVNLVVCRSRRFKGSLAGIVIDTCNFNGKLRRRSLIPGNLGCIIRTQNQRCSIVCKSSCIAGHFPGSRIDNHGAGADSDSRILVRKVTRTDGEFRACIVKTSIVPCPGQSDCIFSGLCDLVS